MKTALLIDVGNSRSKFASSDGSNTTLILGSIATQSSSNDWEVFLKTIALHNTFEYIIGVCVAGQAIKEAINQHCIRIWGKTAHWLTGDTPLLGIENHYQTPHTLGPDRYLAAYGTSQRSNYHSNFVLATFGTATTIDWVAHTTNVKGDPIYQYHGGLITPGLELMLTSLNLGTAKLPALDASLFHPTPVPKTTADAILQGVHIAQVAVVERFYQQCQSNSPNKMCNLYIAGGYAKHLHRWFNESIKQLEHPIFDGLICYLKHNQIY